MTRIRGFTLLEILIALVVIAIGLIGIASLQGHSVRAEMESYQRAQALILMSDMVNRIDANRGSLQCYADIGNATQAGKDQSGVVNCAAYGVPATQQIAISDVAEWHRLLTGSAEVVGGTNAGAMIDAYGCITFDGIDAITVSVYWQGLAPTVDAAVSGDCVAVPAYGAGMRRGVGETMRSPNLP